MKIVVLNGSARACGNTRALIEYAFQKLNRTIFHLDILNIADHSIQYCRGCQRCKQTRQCVQHDDIDRIYDHFSSADIIGIASPSYWGAVIGQLKGFFDRSTPYSNTIDNHTTFTAGKYGISIRQRAGVRPHENQEIIKSINHYFSHLEISPHLEIGFKNIETSASIDTSGNAAKVRRFIDALNTWGQAASLRT